MSNQEWILIFQLDKQKYALPLALTDRIIPCIALDTDSVSTNISLGSFIAFGRKIEVLPARQMLGLPKRDSELTDCLVLLAHSYAKYALLVDDVEGVVQYSPEQVVGRQQLIPQDVPVDVLNQDGEMIFICDLHLLFGDSVKALSRVEAS
jgi:chemotaxis signal transduction protein